MVPQSTPLITTGTPRCIMHAYTAFRGSFRPWLILVQITTRHDRPSINEVRALPQVTSTPGSCKVHLLQITVDALYTNRHISRHVAEHISHLVSYAYKIWAPMIMFLIDAGLTVPLDDPAVTTALDVACYEGNLDHVKKLLDCGVYFDAGRGSVGSYALSLTPGLHSATRRGHRETVICLLRHGACARTKYLYKAYPYEGRLLNAIAAVCATNYNRVIDTRGSGYLDACEALFDAGVDEKDQRILLEEQLGKAASVRLDVF